MNTDFSSTCLIPPMRKYVPSKLLRMYELPGFRLEATDPTCHTRYDVVERGSIPDEVYDGLQGLPHPPKVTKPKEPKTLKPFDENMPSSSKRTHLHKNVPSSSE
ncbi:hypothetical protein N7454_002929 [Penicillium verhagenii]|nr:hypothetical protein N7454_002929 [Penicillium verhagenii]